MNAPAKSCYLYTENKSFPNIYLPNNVALAVGRNVDSQITDLKCSREQVRLCANYEERIVSVEQIGKKSCGFNGTKTVLGEKYLAKHDDELELIYGNYLYKIEFNPQSKINNNTTVIPSNIKKRSIVDLESDSDNESSDINENCRKKLKNSDEKIDSINDESIASGSKINFPIMSNILGENGTWESIDEQSLMIFTSNKIESRNKIASYDMDGTLITTQSGKVFPKDYNDWKILFPNIPGALKKYHNEGFKIVIFTNQGALGSGKSKPSEFKRKIERIIGKLQVPVQVFIATGRDRYRKPMIGMWETLINKFNDNIIVDKNESFYVGDAAGRPKDWQLKAKKDHSMVDRLFALNLHLKFQTPEEHFLGQKPAKYNLPSFNPKNLRTDIDLFDPSDTNIDGKCQEIIILVGGPGSGKSNVALNHLKNYVHINRDTLGSWQKCISSMKKALDDGKCVVIDNTNPDVASRKRFLDVANIHNVPARCFIMNTSLDNAKHNNRFRELTDSSHMVVSDIIINSYIKNYVEPSVTEGFKDIVRVNFIPKFTSDELRQLYEMYLLEK
ncbi:hypothetical protein PV327_010695 [Microctonus hyperodae]|uniref:PNK FHA domain-containing protein n=1 Tax=Microctonus hyperodae TaxID=165561 RepID=A0AA39EZ01_MICHY|nr:hypothetical protein PV327_010695 [Microctonus hyperodae]